MASSNEWTEWHLTPRGWEHGSYKLDGSRGEVAVPPPTGSVIAYRYRERQSIDVAPTEKWTELVGTTGTPDEVKRLVEEHGPCPERLHLPGT